MGKKRPDAPKATSAFENNPFAALSKVAPAPSQKREGESPPVADEGARDEAGPELSSPGSTLVKRVIVRRQKKGRGGKTVTLLSGLPTEQLGTLLPRLKKALGCGAVIEGEDIVLLGSLEDRAEAWLRKAGVEKVVRGS